MTFEQAAVADAAMFPVIHRPATPNYPFGPFVVERPMPASKQDIAELRQIYRWAKSSKAPREARERILADALAKALTYLEEPDTRVNVVGYILAALHQSMRKVGPNVWAVRDRDLQHWALSQIEELLGGPFHPHQDS
jgi:hypothetical protein